MAKRILLVDDDPEQIEYASAVLEENGYVAIAASNGLEGMEKARKEKPDLILLDLLMPEKGGIVMYRELRKEAETKNIPVIVLSGVARGAPFEARMMSQDPSIPAPDGYIEKPMKPSTMLKMVGELIP
jgi:CheY-like chemotaxis protein